MAENIDAERAAFEAWFNGTMYREDARDAMETAWQAARRIPSASIGEDGLPELPPPDVIAYANIGDNDAYSPMLVERIRRDAVAADRVYQKARIMHLTHERDQARADLRKLGEESPQAVQGVKTWQERMSEVGWERKHHAYMDSRSVFMEAEIADLRAHLARQSQGTEAEFYAIWDAAKAEAAMYVEAHCVDGEMHARHIMSAARPKASAAPPLSSEQQAAPRNQCDGCCQGAAVDEYGNHIDSNRKPFMYCQKRRYSFSSEQKAEKGEGA